MHPHVRRLAHQRAERRLKAISPREAPAVEVRETPKPERLERRSSWLKSNRTTSYYRRKNFQWFLL